MSGKVFEITLDVQMTSLRLMFIHVSQLTEKKIGGKTIEMKSLNQGLK